MDKYLVAEGRRIRKQRERRVSVRLLKRIQEHPDLAHVVAGASEKELKLEGYRYSAEQRAAGAWSWGMRGRNIGSASTMTECLKAEEWSIYKCGWGDLEIIPKI